MSKCKSCGAEIVWTETTRGRRMPVDAEPSERGNVLVAGLKPEPMPKAYVYGSLEALQLRDQGVELHAAHHATCPNADDWRTER